MSCKIKCPDTWGELIDASGIKDACPYFVCTIPENAEPAECKDTWNKLLFGCNHECYDGRIPDVLKAHFNKIFDELDTAGPGYECNAVVMYYYLQARRNHNV